MYAIRSYYALLQGAAPALAHALDSQALTGRAAFRATTPDYLPLVGALPDEAWVVERFAKLRDDSNWSFPARITSYNVCYTKLLRAGSPRPLGGCAGAARQTGA